jgi:hypothetical protein
MDFCWRTTPRLLSRRSAGGLNIEQSHCIDDHSSGKTMIGLEVQKKNVKHKSPSYF